MDSNPSMMVDMQKDSGEMQTVLPSSLFQGPVDVDYADPSYLISSPYQAQAYPLYDLISPATGSTSSSSSFGGDGPGNSAHLLQSQGSIYPPHQGSGQQIGFANLTSPEMTSFISSNSSTSSSSVDERYTRSAAATHPSSVPASSTFNNGDSSRPDGRYNVRHQSGADGGQSASIQFEARASISNVVPGYQYQPAPLRLQPAPRGRNCNSDVHPHKMPPTTSPSYTVSPTANTPHQSPSSNINATSRSSSDDVGGSLDTQTKQARIRPAISSSSPVNMIQQRQIQNPAISEPPATSPTATRSQQIQEAPRKWSQEDILALVHVLNEVDGRSWTEIAKRSFPNGKFIAGECHEKWKELSKEKKAVSRGPWTQQEDQALIDAVTMLGPEKWVVIATQVGARNGKQCRERWHNHLSPDIKKGPFSAEEDEIIFHWYSMVGSKWSEIAKHLPGRPDNMIKNHFNTSLQRQKRRLRHIEKVPAGSLKSERDGSPKEHKEEATPGPRSLEDRFESLVKTIRPASRSISSHFGSILNSPTDGPSAALSMTGLGLGLPHSSSRGRPDAALPSASGSSQYTKPTLSQSPATCSDRYMYSPLTSARSYSSVSTATSPVTPHRHGYTHSRSSYHPYSYGEYASTQQQHRGAGHVSKLATSPRYNEEAQLTPPSTPGASSSTVGYTVYCPPNASQARPAAATQSLEPLSAPSFRENFSEYPSTPARRATVAVMPSCRLSGQGWKGQPVQPTTPAGIQTSGTMYFGQKSFTLPVGPGALQPQSQGQDQSFQHLSSSTQATQTASTCSAMHLSALTGQNGYSSPVLRQDLISPRPSTAVNAGHLENYAAAQDLALASSQGQARAEAALQKSLSRTVSHDGMYACASAQDAYFAMRSNSLSSSGASTGSFVGGVDLDSTEIEAGGPAYQRTVISKNYETGDAHPRASSGVRSQRSESFVTPFAPQPPYMYHDGPGN